MRFLRLALFPALSLPPGVRAASIETQLFDAATGMISAAGITGFLHDAGARLAAAMRRG